MNRIFILLIFLPVLNACSIPTGLAFPKTLSTITPNTAHGAYDFNWHLSGDRQVAPLQVFDDGRRTWLQFAAEQAIPAIFAEIQGREQTLAYQKHSPYIVLDGKWPTLIFRGAKLIAYARYDHSTQTATSLDSHYSPKPLLSSKSTAQAFEEQHPLTSSKSFQANLSDSNMRRLLVRWAKEADWTFDHEHWTVDVDIPLAGSADFGNNFKQAVRYLLASTELADRPVQPCFYSNHVLRVVPLNEVCDRTSLHPESQL